jgi:hypothetical protein
MAVIALRGPSLGAVVYRYVHLKHRRCQGPSARNAATSLIDAKRRSGAARAIRLTQREMPSDPSDLTRALKQQRQRAASSDGNVDFQEAPYS